MEVISSKYNRIKFPTINTWRYVYHYVVVYVKNFTPDITYIERFKTRINQNTLNSQPAITYYTQPKFHKNLITSMKQKELGTGMHPVIN